MTRNKLQGLLARIDTGLERSSFESTGEGASLRFRVSVYGPDNDRPEAPHQWWDGRWWSVEGLDEAAVIRTALLAVLTYVEHEARERFKFDGESLFQNQH